MKRKLIITGLLLGTLVLLVGLGVSTYRNASAATPVADDVSFSTQMPSVEAGKGRGLDGQDDQYLADALGITTDELSAARQTAYKAALVQALDQGLITQAQADSLTSDGTAFPFGGRWIDWLAQNGIDSDTFLADALGISVDELQAARSTARNARIDQAVADGDITAEQALLMKARYALSTSQRFKDSMQSAYAAAIQQAVDDGLITQEQADLLLQETMSFNIHGFGGPELFGGRGGGQGHPGGFPGDISEQSEQTETP